MMEDIGYEGADFWQHIQELEQQEAEEAIDDFFFKGIVDTRVRSKARRKALLKIYYGDKDGKTENLGDC